MWKTVISFPEAHHDDQIIAMFPATGLTRVYVHRSMFSLLADEVTSQTPQNGDW